MSVQSQDVYLNATTLISALSGGGSSGPIPSNPSFSTVTTGDLTTSSINGTAYPPVSPTNPQLAVSTLIVQPNTDGSMFYRVQNATGSSTILTVDVTSPNSINTSYSVGSNAGLLRTNISTSSYDQRMTGAANNYVDVLQTVRGAAPSFNVQVVSSSVANQMNLNNNSFSTPTVVCNTLNAPAANVSTLNTSVANISSLNGFSTDSIPYVYTQPGGLVDKTISSISGTPGSGIIAAITASGAPLSGRISTIQGVNYVVSGVFRLSTVGTGGFTPGGAGYLSIWGGGGTGLGLLNACYWTYAQIAELAAFQGSGNNNVIDIQWMAPGNYTAVNQEGTGPGNPGNSTIQYYAYVSGGWPGQIQVCVSSLIGTIATTDANLVKVMDNGPIYLGSV